MDHLLNLSQPVIIRARSLPSKDGDGRVERAVNGKFDTVLMDVARLYE